MPTKLTLSSDLTNLVSAPTYQAAKTLLGITPRATTSAELIAALAIGDAVIEGVTLLVASSGVTVPAGRTLYLEKGAILKVSSYNWAVTGSVVTLGVGATVQSVDGTGSIDGDNTTHRTSRETYGIGASRQYGITAAADSIVRGITIKNGFNEAIFGGAAHRTNVIDVTVSGGGKGPLFTQSDDLVITDLVWRDGLCNHTGIYPHGLTLYSCTSGKIDGYSVINMGAVSPAPSYLISLFNLFSCSSMRISNYYCGQHNSGTDHPPFALAEDGGNGNVYTNLVMTHMRGGSGVEMAGRNISINNFILDYTQGMVGSPYNETGFLLIGIGIQSEIGILTSETQVRSQSGLTNTHISNGRVIGCDRPFDIRNATGLVVNSVKFIGSVLTGPRVVPLKSGADYGWVAGLDPVCDDIEFVNCSSYYGVMGFTWTGGNNIRYRNCRAIGCTAGIGNTNIATKRVGELIAAEVVTADAGGTSTQIVHTGLALELLGAVDWTHVDLTFYTGSRSWEVRRVASYNSGTKTITLATALSGAPTAGDLFNLHMPHGLVTIEGGEYRDAEVWADIPAAVSYNGSAGNFVSGTEYQFTSPYCERLMVGQKIVIRGILSGAADLSVVVSRVNPLNNDLFWATASASGTLGTLTAGTGTISSSGRTVTGVGTNFNTYQKQVYIKAGGEWRRVVRQDSTLVWTIDTPFTTPLSGATWEVAIYNLGQATISGGDASRIRLSRYFGNVITRNTTDPITEVFVTPGSVLANLRSNPGTGAIANLKQTTTGNLVTQSFPSSGLFSNVSTTANFQFTPLSWTKFDGNVAAGLSTTPTARIHAAVTDGSSVARWERTGLASLDLDFNGGTTNFIASSTNITFTPLAWTKFGGNLAAGLSTTPTARIHAAVADGSTVARWERTGLASLDLDFNGGTTNFTSPANIIFTDVNTASTNKNVRISLKHYTSGEEPVGLIFGVSQAALNGISIGGGSSQLNTATSISFFTASATTITTGTAVMAVDKSDSLTQTAMLLMHNGTLKRVEVGASDSAGAGYRTLRITN